MARSDTFERADSGSSLGTPSDGGSAWEALDGTWGISGNQAYNPSGNEHGQAVLESGLSDGRVRATVTSGGTSAAEVWCRVSNAGNGIMCHHFGGGGGRWFLYRHVVGGFEAIANAPGACPPGSVIGFDMDGDQLTFVVDGVPVIGPIAEPFNQTATKHGLGAFLSTTVRYGDFSVTGLAQDPDPDPGPGGILLIRLANGSNMRFAVPWVSPVTVLAAPSNLVTLGSSAAQRRWRPSPMPGPAT